MDNDVYGQYGKDGKINIMHGYQEVRTFESEEEALTWLDGAAYADETRARVRRGWNGIEIYSYDGKDYCGNTVMSKGLG
jgi:hypothetical protein